MHEEPDPDKTRTDGPALGRVIEKAARRWHSPLAIPLMDLRLEKIDLLALAGVPEDKADTLHFSSPLDEAALARLTAEHPGALCAGSNARNEALAYIRTVPGLLGVGMAIGPFSLTTRLLADPIGAAAIAGSGIEQDESEEVRLLWQCLRVAEAAVLRSVRSQVACGARAVMICEPAANKAFISPRQKKAGSSIFERLVMEPNLRVKAALEAAGCDLIFHDCGELIDPMVEAFATRLHPVILSLGSSRKLWEDARLVPRDVVLYGDLPSKSFYSDGAMPLEEVVRLTGELVSGWQPAVIRTSWVPSAMSCSCPKRRRRSARKCPPCWQRRCRDDRAFAIKWKQQALRAQALRLFPFVGRAPSSRPFLTGSTKAFVTADNPAQFTARPEAEASASAIAEWLTEFFPAADWSTVTCRQSWAIFCLAGPSIFRSRPTPSKSIRRMEAACCATHTGIAALTCTVSCTWSWFMGSRVPPTPAIFKA